MNHLSADEQAMVREHPGNYSARTRNDVADQEDQILADMRDIALDARGDHAAGQVEENLIEKVGVRAASQKLSQLVQRAYDGETILITVNGAEKAQLCPVAPRITDYGPNARPGRR